MTKPRNGNSQTASTGISIPQLNLPGKTVDNTGQIGVDENKTEEDVRSSDAVHTRFGRRIQFPMKYAEDFEVEN